MKNILLKNEFSSIVLKYHKRKHKKMVSLPTSLIYAHIHYKVKVHKCFQVKSQVRWPRKGWNKMHATKE